MPRPQGGPVDHSTSQDLASYLAGNPTRTATTIFDRIHGERPKPPRGKGADFKKHVASTLSIRDGVITSGEKLLRDPEKLTTLRETQHGKIEAGEMEAIGFWTACLRQGVRSLVVRGISDFGDEFKDDRFHVLASAAAAAVTADFIARGLHFPATPPVAEAAGGRDGGGIRTTAPIPPVPGTLRPGRFVTSPRLDGAVRELVHALDAGERLLAFCGRPGDGKTQVAQRLAGLRAVDIYYALPRFDGHNDVWRDGLRHLASELLGHPPRESEPEVLAAAIRSTLARRGDVRLILDNVDAPSPFDLNLLLPHDARAACVLVGAHDPGVARTVRLPPPNAAEFRDIFLANRGTAAAPSEEQASLLDQIGMAVSNSAIVASCVAQGCSAERLTEDLAQYRQLLPGQVHEAQNRARHREILGCARARGAAARRVCRGAGRGRRAALVDAAAARRRAPADLEAAGVRRRHGAHVRRPRAHPPARSAPRRRPARRRCHRGSHERARDMGGRPRPVRRAQAGRQARARFPARRPPSRGARSPAGRHRRQGGGDRKDVHRPHALPRRHAGDRGAPACRASRGARLVDDPRGGARPARRHTRLRRKALRRAPQPPRQHCHRAATTQGRAHPPASHRGRPRVAGCVGRAPPRQVPRQGGRVRRGAAAWGGDAEGRRSLRGDRAGALFPPRAVAGTGRVRSLPVGGQRPHPPGRGGETPAGRDQRPRLYAAELPPAQDRRAAPPAQVGTDEHLVRSATDGALRRRSGAVQAGHKPGDSGRVPPVCGHRTRAHARL